ncbi:DUF5801 domain-containing protein [Tsuneonella sp. YG55]|uniref:DUF5801 domain-containing protein n=1 Tax=Tsuneonella litorea TaxID=2976475 RepID=A0A9X2W0L4_9SPHN|nr:DUF5801 repeats-in-toxin domain-containing protein [Tsuneonella litorea]MCT2558920.1 DUF5801 domain-containing protein [Tsuneonella litorea]
MDLQNNGPEKFGDDETTELQNSGNASPVAGSGVTRVLTADSAGVVVLPAGTELGDIQIEGRDLVVVGADGVRYVIPDGAIIVPQLVIGDVAIPPLNLAALLVGNEPQPAAGNPQSSGGNFASAVGPIQAAYGLGDLLPYTELNFPQPEEQEIIPAIPDREPTITIITADQPLGVQAATATVAESGLPARNGEPAGTNSAATTETTSGTIVFASPDGVASITINGVPFTGVGQVISSPRGDLAITSFDPVAGTIGFTYTLTDNLLNATLADAFSVSVTDPDGDVATATLTISAIDDAPIARNDTDAVAAGSYAPESGNVITAAGTTSGSVGADTPGADGAAVSRIVSSNVPANADTTFDSSGNLEVAGQYGQLLIKADGSYTYTRAAGTPGGVADAFTYTLTDGDGSTSTATLTISIGDAKPVVTSVPPVGVFEAGTLVFESGLPSRPGEAPGTNAPAPTERTSGKVTFTGGDGPVTATINGVAAVPGATVNVPGVGTLVVDTFNPVTGELTYTFTLADNTSGDNTSVTFNILVTDVDGDSAPGTFVIAIRDDSPQAKDDMASQTVENAPVSVNVLANDVQGADSVQPSTVQLVAGTLSGTGTLVNNGDGTFTYTPGPGENGPVTFDYSITDGDGDPSIATVTIALVPDSAPLVGEGPNLSVDEDGFASANVDASPLQADPAEIDAGGNLTDSGSVTVDFGGDVPSDLAGSIVLLDDPAYDGQLKTLDGNDVTFAVEGGVLVGRDSGGAEVIRIAITGAAAGPNPGEVVYTYATLLSQPILHGTAGTEDFLTLSGITYQVTDLDGDKATGSFSVSVGDDVPTALDEAGGSLAEGATVTGTLDFVAGADGAGVTAIDGTTLIFGADGYSQAITLYDATGTVPVGTIIVKADGTYAFTAADPLDNPVGAVASFTVTDGDGDAATASITFAITDANAPTGGLAQAALDDDGLAGGNPASTTFDLETDAGDALADNDESTFAGTLTFTDGGDSPATITFAAGVDGSFAMVGTERVQYTVSGDTLTATVAAQDAGGTAQDRAGTTLFTVQITDANAGTYRVTLVSNILHDGGPNEENPAGTDATASIGFTVTDSDGSSAPATLTITFDDDAPTASAVSVTQDAENAAFLVDITGSYAAGADGVDLSKVTWTQPAQGTVTYDGAGHFTYTPAAGAGSDSLGDSFTYTVVDGDGDTATATVTVALQPDSAPVANDATARIDDDGLPAGNAASNPGGTDDDQNAGETGTGTTSEAVWTGTLSVQPGANDAPLTYSLAPAAGSGMVGTEAVDFTYDEATHTLTATVSAGEARANTVLFTVQITDVNTGAYTVRLINPIMHPTLDGEAGDDTENNVSVALTFIVSDSDPVADSETGTLTIDFDDDTPTVTPDAITVTQGAENTAFDFVLVEGTHFFEGADGVDLASGVTFTQAAQGTISYDGAGTFTYTPASGAGSDGATSDSFTFTVTDADGDSVTKTVNVTLQPDSKPMAGTPTGLALDEDGLTGANADDGQTDPAEVTGTNSASDLSGSVVVDYGKDVPADLLGSVVLVDLAGYDTQLKTLDDNFVTFGLEFNTTTMRDDLVGRSVGGDEVIRIAITGATAGPNPGEVTYTYAATLSQPVKHGTAGTEDTETLSGVTLQFTDGDDSDKTTASFDVTVRDDVPSLDVTAGTESGVVLTTQDAETDGDPTASDSATSTVGMVSAAFGGVFGLTFQKGADGGPTPTLSYVLDLKTDGGLSGLSSAGAPIYLYQLDDETVVGSTAAANPGSIDGTAVFSVSVAADGTVTLVQYQQIDHVPEASPVPGTDAPFDDQFASLADDLITLTARSSLTDGDGDTASDSETIDIGANLRFADDGPSLSGDVTAAAGVTIDETTAGPPAGFGTGIVATSMGAAITFAEAFGADGPAVGGGLTYSIEITGPMGATPFATAVGDYPVTLVAVDGDTIEGRYTDSAMVEHTAFRLDIGPDGGLTLTQFVALEHVQDGNTAADYDDALYLTADGTAGGASLVSARITVTDYDGDTASGAAAIGANVVFRDDGVDAVLDTNSVAAGSYAPIMGNVLANDYRGADGSSITAVSNTDAGTTGTLAGDEITIQGEYGLLVVNVNTGAYTYTRDPGMGGGEQDVFSYTLTDADGDFDAATLTISIGNLTPVAGTAQATVDDDGLANGNPGGTGDIDANTPAGRTADLDQASTEAVFKGVLGGTLGDGTNTFTFLSSQTATMVGQETVSYTVSPDGALLTATITSSPTGRTGTLFTVEITDQTTGAYTLTLVQPVLHDTLDMMTGDDTENDASIDLAYQITDQDNDPSIAPGTLNVLFDDDTPTVTPDAITVTQGAENTAFDFVLVEGTHFFEGADGVDLASGVTFTQAAQGTISYDGAGTFTYTPASGAGSDGATSDSFTFTVTDADGDSVTKTVNVTLQPDSKPMAGTPTGLALDEDGLTGANADDGQTDPAEVTGTNSASDLSGSVVVDYGKDVPADLLGSVVLVDLAGYDTQLKTLDDNFVTFGLEFNTTTMRDDLVGRSVGGDEVIRIAITGATAGPNPGEVTYTYAATLSQPVKHGTAGTEDTETLSGVTLQFTDGDDSDKTTASFDVTVRDDVPSLDVTAGTESGVVLTTQDAETDGDPTASDSATSTVGMVSAAFGGVFGLTFQKGADGGPTPTLSYVLDLKTDGGLSGLSSAGAPIYLYQLDDETVVGSTAAANPGSIDGTAVFSVSVAADGTVTLVQYQQIDHVPEASPVPGTDAPFDDQFASLADDLITLTARSSLTDGDGDTASDSETIDIGANLRFADDGPSLSGDVTAAAGVTIDETTAGPPAGFGTGIVATSMGAAITFAEAFGADGPAVGGGLTYSIEITGPMGATPFATAVGDYPVTLVAVDGDTIEGRYTDSAMVEHTAFRLDIGPDGGLTLTQFVALEHVQDGNTAADYDDALYLTADGTAGGASLVSARITVTDYDGDTASGAAAIGANVVFRDDGVDAVLDTNSVAAGSYAPIMGNVLANDYRGADGSSITAVSNTDAGTTGTLAGDEITIQGEYGLLVVNVNTGAYTYTRDPGMGGGEQDVFSYTLTDADGDFDAATLTISIGNLTPVAGTAQATVDDDGLANGNPGGTGDIDANTPAGRTADLDQASTEAVFKGVLGGTLGDGTNTFTFLSSQTATMVGQETVSYTVSPDGALLTATITSSPTGRTGTLFTVEITDQTTGAYTLTLVQPVLHDTLDMMTGDDTENDASIDLAYQITDQDNDPSIAPGTLNVLFDDDTPRAISPEAASLSNNATGSDTGYLSIDGLTNDYGADGPGSVRFSQSLETISTGLTSGAAPIKYDVSADGLTLVAYTGTDPVAGKVFMVVIDPTTNQYSIQMSGSVDSVTKVSLDPTDASFVGGNDPWAGFDRAGPTDILLTPTGTGDQTLNTSNILLGVGGGNAVDNGEGVRIDFVNNLSGNPAKSVNGGYGTDGAAATLANRDHTFTSHYNVNGASVLLSQESGNSPTATNVVANFAAYDDTDSDNVVGDGMLDQITGITITYYGVTYTDPMSGSQIIVPTTTATNYTISGHIFTVTLRADGTVDVKGIEGESGSAGTGTEIAVFTDNGYNSLIVSNASPGTSFKIAGFGASVPTSAPVNFTIPVEIVDADGDVASGTGIAVTLNPAPIVLDLNGDSVQFLSVADGVAYDYGNGSVATAWAHAADGILVRDDNASGSADHASEFVFGGGGLTDLEALAAQYGDTLDAADADFAKFGVWQDANGNGLADEGEFHSLGELGIVSINLVSDGVSYKAAGGDVSVAGSSTFTRADGTTGTLADASFATAAKSAQRTAELLTTAAMAGAAVSALPVAAQPAMADGMDADALPVFEPLSIRSEPLPDGTVAADQVRPALGDFASHEAVPISASIQRSGGETSDAHFIANDSAFHDLAPAPAWLSAAPGPQAGQAAGDLFAGMGAEGTMQALLSIAPQAPSPGDAAGGSALAALEGALSDFSGEALVDGIVEHFAAAGQPIPMGADAGAIADAGSFMLMQGIGGSGADFAAMINLPDAHDDASMLAAAQA